MDMVESADEAMGRETWVLNFLHYFVPDPLSKFLDSGTSKGLSWVSAHQIGRQVLTGLFWRLPPPHGQGLWGREPRPYNLCQNLGSPKRKFLFSQGTWRFLGASSKHSGLVTQRKRAAFPGERSISMSKREGLRPVFTVFLRFWQSFLS
jgi:hypothetical protein